MRPKEHSCCTGDAHDRGKLSDWNERLQSSGYKLTKPRLAVLKYLHQQVTPTTNRQIYSEISGQCDMASIYRTIHLLLEINIVQQFDFGDGVARYELMSPEGDNHHHHMICTECSTVVEVNHCFPESLIETLAKHTGFKKITHNLEFFGICPCCQ